MYNYSLIQCKTHNSELFYPRDEVAKIFIHHLPSFIGSRMLRGHRATDFPELMDFHYLWPSDLPEFQVKSSSSKTQLLAVGKCLEHTDRVKPEGHGSASVSLILAPYFQMGKLSLKEVVYP